MYALLLTWDLSSNDPEVFQELRSYIAAESWQRYRGVEGLIQKVWFSNEETGVFGAFYLWQSRESRERETASMYRIEEKTGVKPVIRRFEIEAIQEGTHHVEELLERGQAWASDP